MLAEHTRVDCWLSDTSPWAGSGLPYGQGIAAKSASRPDAITRADAASILVVHVATVDRLSRRGALSRGRKYPTVQRSRIEQLP